MMGILLFLFALYLLYKSIPWLLAWWLRRQRRNYQEQMGQAFEQAARRQSESGRGAQYQADISEDAEYEDIAGTREEVVQETFVAEEQIVDAEFEEI